MDTAATMAGAATREHPASRPSKPHRWSTLLDDVANRSCILALFTFVVSLVVIYMQGVNAPIPPLTLAIADVALLSAVASRRSSIGTVVFSSLMVLLAASLIAALQMGWAQQLVMDVRSR
jgi:hypothetical protein